ncbi:MAG: DUF2213 domain-containing protein [Sandaracinaceae bacterium]|nr:DUF2213 domain-containing protein [Sandaracinaceae bacterium]
MIVRLDRAAHTYTATLAVAGVLYYDPGHHPELVPRATLADPAALETLRGVPIVAYDHTELDPPEHRVIGRVIASRMDGDELVITMRIDDAATRAAIDSGELQELSPAYQCDVHRSSGYTSDGTRYDTEQRDRRYAHVALLPPMHSRCGASCTIRRDAVTAKRITTAPTIHATDTDDLSPIQRHREWSKTRVDAHRARGPRARHGRADASACARCDDDGAPPPPDDGSTAARESAARTSAWLSEEMSTPTSAPPITAAEAQRKHAEWSRDAWRRPRT